MRKCENFMFSVWIHYNLYAISLFPFAFSEGLQNSFLQIWIISGKYITLQHRNYNYSFIKYHNYGNNKDQGFESQDNKESKQNLGSR